MARICAISHFLARKSALALLLRHTGAVILLDEHIAEDGPTVFAYACKLGAEGIVSKRVDGTYRPGPSRVWIKVLNPASIAAQRERSEIWNRRASGGARRRLSACNGSALFGFGVDFGDR